MIKQIIYNALAITTSKVQITKHYSQSTQNIKAVSVMTNDLNTDNGRLSSLLSV
jgi:hypothetical protein